MKNNTIKNSMAGVGGLSQCNAINDLSLANAPFCPTAEPCAPDHLANLKPGDSDANILFQADGGKLPIVADDSGKTATQDGAIHGSLGNFHDVERIAKALGAAQRRGIINLTMRWGKSGEHQAMKRLWYRNDIPLLLDHKHRTDDCWKLRPIGKAVREYLRGAKP